MPKFLTKLKNLSPKKRLLLLAVVFFVVLSVISALVLFVFASRGGNPAGVPVSSPIASSPTGAPTTGSTTPEVPSAAQIKYLHTADSNEIRSYDPETKQVVARQILPAACKDRAVKDVSLNDGKFNFSCERFKTDTLVFNHGSRVLTEEHEDVLPIAGMDQWVMTTDEYKVPYLINKKTGESKRLKAYVPFNNIVEGVDLFRNYYSFRVGDKSYAVVLQFVAPGLVEKLWRIELSNPNYPATEIKLPASLQIGDTMLAIQGEKVAQSPASEKGFYATQGNKMQLINYLTGKVEVEYDLGRELLAGVSEADSPLLAAIPGGRYVVLGSHEFFCESDCKNNGLFLYDTQERKMAFEHLTPNFPGGKLIETNKDYFLYELYNPYLVQAGEDSKTNTAGEIYRVDMKTFTKTQLLTLPRGERLVTVEKTN